ncbi:hypothetical protein BGZ99_008781 [Dissophora globulifera]|uniref:L domain-like protein n=1 Tax=Dissophora globulifera TaxID=979702 RepID=A0A9P6RX15_9FUNG|nr:hypothetical protein BGZ99_008781 [Dissophora globulifera]
MPATGLAVSRSEDTTSFPQSHGSPSTMIRDPTTSVYAHGRESWQRLRTANHTADAAHSWSNSSVTKNSSSSRNDPHTRPKPKSVHARRKSSSARKTPTPSSASGDDLLSSQPLAAVAPPGPAVRTLPISIPPPINATPIQPPRSPRPLLSHVPNATPRTVSPTKKTPPAPIQVLLSTKDMDSSSAVHAIGSANLSARFAHPTPLPSPVDTNEDVMDIEACIDDPVLAPLGRHVNRRRSPKRSSKGHVDINVVRPSSPTTFIQQQERESNVPVTSLVLRRRRMDCAQLEQHLQGLQPILDPKTMSLQSPLLHLAELDLSRNRLSSLPADLTKLAPSLIYLNLSHNQFTEIPLELCQLTHLQVLIMSQNKIEGAVPEEIFSSLTQLKNLRLCSNEITSLPDTLAHLDKLESLSMGSVYGGNLLTAFPADCIQYMTALRELELNHNKIRFLPEDIGHPHSHLRQLSASDNKLEAIPKSIGQCSELRSLNLGRNHLTSLPTEIADLKQLDTLDLSENLLCVIPGDVADFLTKTTLLLTGNPFTRGYCDVGQNPVNEAGGVGADVNVPTDEERYAALLKNLSRRAILNAAASSSSSTHTATLSSLASARESPRLAPAGGESSYEMDQDEKLDYHLYYTRHALSSRPPSRADSINSLNDAAGTGSSAPRFNVEAVNSDIDSFFDYIPSPSSVNATSLSTTTVLSNLITAEPSIFDSTLLTVPVPLSPASSTLSSPLSTPQLLSPATGAEPSNPPLISPLVGERPTTTSTPHFLPSLKELAARSTLQTGKPLPLEFIPEGVVEYMQPGARPCGYCRGPYVKEWVSSVRVKSYQGHPAVARRVRFCSSTCWKRANDQMEAEEASGVVSSMARPGATTGHLPPVVTTAGYSPEESNSIAILDSATPSPMDGVPPPSVLTTMPLSSESMRTCKGGQSYWPVIDRQQRGRSLTTGSPLAKAAATESSGSITKASVCSGRCAGAGVCDW